MNAKGWFAHLNFVPMTVMAVWLNLANILGHVETHRFYAVWGLIVTLLVMTSSTAMMLHEPDTCRICVPVRRKAALKAANPHWSVKVFHYGHLMYIALVAYWLWVIPQVFMHPQAVFVYGQLVAVPVIAAWGYVCQVHVSWCTKCWRLPGGGGGPRRRRRPPVGGGMVVPLRRDQDQPRQADDRRRVA